MSRKRPRSSNPNPAGSAPTPAVTPEPAPIPTPRGSPLACRVAIVLTLAWAAVMAALAIKTSNPVSLSYRQLKEADYVVAATLIPGQPQRINVARELYRAPWIEQDLPANPLELSNLDAAAGERPFDREVMVPLTGFRGHYQVAASPADPQPPQIYPLTPGTERELTRITRTLQPPMKP